MSLTTKLTINITCAHCGLTWQPRKLWPLACQRCKRYFTRAELENFEKEYQKIKASVAAEAEAGAAGREGKQGGVESNNKTE